ncbi:MAG: gluconate 2-dehydrogenase subunit 3 family protein [Dehalococcoidia bacterium]
MHDNSKDDVVSEDQLLALTSVLDLIIPASDDRRLPAAGQLGLASYVWTHTAESRPLFVQGLAAIDRVASSRGVSGFAALSVQDQLDVLGELDAAESAFLPILIFHTYAGYYQDAGVIEALGLSSGSPFPNGYEVTTTDLSILDPVRRRSRLYRS